MVEYSRNEFGLSLTAWNSMDWTALDQALRDGFLPVCRRQTYWKAGCKVGVSFFFLVNSDNNADQVSHFLESSGMAWRNVADPIPSPS